MLSARVVDGQHSCFLARIPMTSSRLGLLAHHGQVCNVPDLPEPAPHFDSPGLERLGSRQGDVPRGDGLGAGHLLLRLRTWDSLVQLRKRVRVKGADAGTNLSPAHWSSKAAESRSLCSCSTSRASPSILEFASRQPEKRGIWKSLGTV